MKFISLAGLAALAAGALSGCSEAPFITLTNRSTVELSDIVVSGAGFSQRIDRLAPGAHSDFTIHPDEQTGVRVTFLADGKRVERPESGYVRARGRYVVAVVIEPALTMTVTSVVPTY
jgi:hypothetical protein